MALQIIARGRVLGFTEVYMIITPDGKYYELGDWAEPYIGQTLIISVEEPEEESLEGRLVRPLKRVLQNA